MVSSAKPALTTVLLLLLVIVVAYCDRSFYDVLGVPKSASQSQIKGAYRKLSKQYHPDVSQEADAKTKFQEIAEGSRQSSSLSGAQ
jgi:DnaJ-domain-containing protein 1